MKNSNNQTKTGKNSTTQNLMKTTTSNNMENTSVNRPSSAKKPLPPKPIQKKQYVVEDNMTESRISEAKQGLQLLKKKMSAKGMSRQKISSAHDTRGQKPFQKKQSGKVEEIETKGMYEKKASNKYSEPQLPDQKLNRKKQSKTKKGEQRQIYNPPIPQYRDEEMEKPLNAGKDFNALLEQQMRKQAKQNIQQDPDPYDDNDVELVECSMGCGRMFNANIIVKHEKVCQKVFQSKRKAFDSASHRAPQVDGFDKPKPALNKTQKQPVKKEQDKGKVPKWKQQSLAFRASMKNAKNVPVTEQEKKLAKQMEQQMDTRVKCDFCGRKFEQTAAKRHIPFCETKSKQMPKAPMKKKR